MKPWKIDNMVYSRPEYFIMTGSVVSIVVAPPEAIGDKEPNQRTRSGAHSSVIISREMFESSAIVPSSAPLYSVMKMLDKE